MAKITVDLEAFYGYSCGFQGYGSNDTMEVEVTEKELNSLKKFGKEEITAEDIVAAIESGDTTLKSLHEQLSEKFYYMVEEYWLFEAYNEFLDVNLADHIEQDISDGLYTPVISEDDEDGYDIEGLDEEELDDEDEEYEDGATDEDDYEYDEEEDNYDLEAYYDWVKEHDHEFVAERVGLDLDACRDDEVNYTISLKQHKNQDNLELYLQNITKLDCKEIIYQVNGGWLLGIHSPYDGEIDPNWKDKIIGVQKYDSAELYGINDSIIGAIYVLNAGDKKGLFTLHHYFGMQGAVFFSPDEEPFMYSDIKVYSDWYKWNDYGYAACKQTNGWKLVKVIQYPKPDYVVIGEGFSSAEEAMKSIS